jgi:8-oxo-dGTP diphosphatase
MSWSATNSEGYEAPVALAVDVVVLTVRAGSLCVLVVRREPRLFALPGGFVGASERPRDTAARKLRERTGVAEPQLEQLGAFADPGRDRRGWIPSIAYLALVPPHVEPTDRDASWRPAQRRLRLAFDHARMLAVALDRVEGKLWWSNVARGILPGPFSMSDARAVYEAIAGVRYDAATFARDLKATGLVAATGERRAEGRGRPAALYRFASREPAWGAGRRKRVATGDGR